MKPRVIYLIRHGESAGNVDQCVYKSVPDWQIDLTEKGVNQAKEMAQNVLDDVIKEAIEAWGPRMISEGRKLFSLYSSSWIRARQTARALEERFSEVRAHEDPRLREQEWGNYAEDHFVTKIARERKKFGTFYYRMPYGESGADVYDRVTTFIDTLFRDFSKSDYPLTTAIVSHGLTIKTFLMRWFHWSAEDFDLYKTPQEL
jgi:broad specificity phosphatase PhoE